jgi:hypothetical protein
VMSIAFASECSADRTGARAPPFFNNRVVMWKTQCINAIVLSRM